MGSEDRGINRPIRGIPDVHVPRVSAGPDISGIDTTRFRGLCESQGRWVSGSGIVVSWGMLTREELRLLW